MSENLQVKDLPSTETINKTDKLMVLVDDENNYVNNITIEEFNNNSISNDDNNIIKIGTDGKLYAETASITGDLTKLTEEIGDLKNLTTADQSSVVNAINEIASTTVNGPNTDLSNLTSSGNAKFQYAPFCVNYGAVNSNGENATLYLPGGTAPVEASWEQPVLSANGTPGGDSFAVWASQSDVNSYWIFDGDTETARNASASPYYFAWYTPQAIKIQNLHYTIYSSSGNNAPRNCTLYGSNDNENWTLLKEYTNAVTTNRAVFTIPVNSEGFYNYHKLVLTSSGNTPYCRELTIDATYMVQVSSSTDLLCSPCTITTADGRTKTFPEISNLNCSGVSNGAYKVMKSYETGGLSLVSSLTVSKTAPSSSNGALWLDISTYPLKLKQYTSGNWVINNDLVYMGDINKTSSSISITSNNVFNKYGYLLNSNPVLIEKYQSGTSWYRIWSDGWCMQGGFIPINSGTQGTITFLKAFKDTNYTVASNAANNSYVYTFVLDSIVSKTASKINWYKQNTGIGGDWTAFGYVNL